MAHQLAATQYVTTQWSYGSAITYPDPSNDLQLDAFLTHDSGEIWRVPAYWAGGQTWNVRFAPPRPGRYRVQTACTDPANPGLHDQGATLVVEPYTGSHPLLRHGPLCVRDGGRILEFADGTPFFWLGDTWWMGFCTRIAWPDEFQRLTADRVAKGFSLVQIVAGLYPDMPALDPRGANEAGLAWQEGFAGINPAYFDMADLRMQWLVQSGLVPCVVGCWGYYLPLMNIDRVKAHWRYLIARWGSYPVIWCLAGEGSMPYYLSPDPDGDRKRQTEGWTEVARYVRTTDPYHRPITIHPTQIGRDQVTDDSVLDFDMLQTGHGGYGSVPNTVATVTTERNRLPKMPVIVAEVNYEGILHGTAAETQRLTYWSAMLSGASGYTYGANGLWQGNTRHVPYGPSPHGASWGDTPWEEAYQLEGSYQLGLAKGLLAQYDWSHFEPHPEWVDPAGSATNVEAPFAAGIPEQVRIIYVYQPDMPWAKTRRCVCALEPNINYRAFYWNPRNGTRHDVGLVEANEEGRWPIPLQPTMSDWVLVLEASADQAGSPRPDRARRSTGNHSPIDLGAVVTEVLQDLSELIADRGVRIHAPQHWPLVWVNRSQAHEAWTEAITRAIGQGHAAPRLTLRADLVSGGVIRCRVLGDGYESEFDLPAALIAR